MTYLGKSTIDNVEGSIYDYGPQLAYVKKPGSSHFVTVTGMNPARTTYKIMDPNGGAKITYADRNYSTPAEGVRGYAGPEYQYTDMSGITISFHSPGDLVIENSVGLKSGHNPLTGIYYNEIPRSSYTQEGIDDYLNPVPDEELDMYKELEIMRPATGDYSLYVMGTGTGTYALYITAIDTNGDASEKSFKGVSITPGEVHNYNFYYANAAGAGIDIGFDGGGQRPKDVNKFLSYARPSMRQTDLPAGTSNYNLIVLYGEDILPSTFNADLNGTDISEKFSPNPGEAQSINLSLDPGRNTLTLSVDAYLNGHVSSDKDRLTFVVK
jgi:hypothetical protein